MASTKRFVQMLLGPRLVSITAKDYLKVFNFRWQYADGLGIYDIMLLP